MRVGYIRTSKNDQNPDLQRRELEAFGCERIFEAQISSRRADRPELRAALDYCREGDELVVWKLDRFGRSLKELIELVNGVRERGIEFVNLSCPLSRRIDNILPIRRPHNLLEPGGHLGRYHNHHLLLVRRLLEGLGPLRRPPG